MNNTFICTHCSTVHPISDRIIFNGQEVCEDCFEQETRICDRCGERIWAEDDCGDEAHMLCEDCEEQYYGHCTECGRLAASENITTSPSRFSTAMGPVTSALSWRSTKVGNPIRMPG